MKLFLVRHGETQWLREGRLQGHSDVPLNEAGHRQSQEAARLLKPLKPERILSSSLRRARETAGWIARECGLPLGEDRRLNEIFFGEWEGKPSMELEASCSDSFRDWISLNDNFCAPRGEPVREVRSRILSFFGEFKEQSLAVVAVSHGGPIRLLLLELLGIPLVFFHSLRLDPGSVTLIEFESGDLRIQNLHSLNGKPEVWGTERLPSEDLLDSGDSR